MSGWAGQIQQSSIPYPDRALLEREIRHDLGNAGEDFSGLTPAELRELEEIHATPASRLLNQLGRRKKSAESLIAFFPLLTVGIFLTKEGTVIEFMKEGGLGMYAILAVGIFLFARELRSAFRLLVVKDHADENLKLDTSSVLLGCLGLVFMGIGWSALGIYISAGASLAADASPVILMTGIKESLTPTILAALLSALIVLAHYGTRRMMQIWSAPVGS